MGLKLPSGCIKADRGSQVAADGPQPSHRVTNFRPCFYHVAGNTCNHIVAIECHLIGNHLLEFVCVLWAGSVL